MIRPYQQHDLQDLLHTWEAASAMAHSFLSEVFQKQERHNIANVYLPQADTWVWEADGKVVGFLSLLGNEIGGLFVDPAYQEEGIGHALIDKARELHASLEVEVFKQNAIGRAFYARYGFELLETKIHEPTGFELLRLRLEKGES